jgi:tetratricopeptide (TPR) repeat protein
MIRRTFELAVAATAASLLALLLPALGQPAEQLGDVRFATSCSPSAQQQFNRAVAILHSFWYDEAVKAFTAVTETDVACAMGYWGVAMSYWYPLWYPPEEAALKAGARAVAKAQQIGAKTDRERDYIEAIAAFYRDSDKLDHRSRSIAYQQAMKQLYLRYPDDREAAVFYALALNATAVPTDKSYAQQSEAAQILNKVFAAQPNHPGAAHYLIHSYDSAPLAELGLPAAICYSKIAPSVPHALHMPSHIFTRLGKWQESIESNRGAAAVAEGYAVQRFGPGIAWGESLHAMDYLAYAYLQRGQDREAKKILDTIVAFRKAAPEVMPAAYALAAVPARYAVERRDWAQAAVLSLPPLAFPWDKFPWTTAMITFTRALGAARTGDLVGAQTEIEHLQSAHDAVIQQFKYWADQIEVQRQAALAMLARARGQDEEAVALMRQASELEASMDKHPVTPGPIVPTRELLGDLLLELNQPAQALSAYERSLSADPNRYRSLFGAAKAAQQAGDAGKANSYVRMFAVLGSQADPQRPELAEAKAWLGASGPNSAVQ